MSVSPLQAIAHRRDAIAEEIDAVKADCAAKIDALEAERTELEIAARVFQRLDTATAQQVLPMNGTETTVITPATLPEMLVAVIGERVAAGLPGITSSEILIAIANRWGEQNPKSVRPTLWRMVQEDRLIKHGELYSLPRPMRQGER